MEVAEELLGLMRDSRGSQPQQRELLPRLETAKRRLLGRRDGCAWDPERATGRALVVCHLATQTIAFLVQRATKHEVAAHSWQKRALLLESTVTSVAAALERSNSDSSEEEERDAVASSEWRHVRIAFKRLLSRAFRAAPTPNHTCDFIAVLVRLCVLLVCGWLAHERAANLSKAEDLLAVCSDFCLRHDAIAHFARRPLLLRAMILLADKRDPVRALGCFRRAVGKPQDLGDDDDGVFHYWYAVTLLQNGLTREAVHQLDRCIAGNYEPVACLSLQALIQLQVRDFHKAAEKLQRALEVDFAQSLSMFNYALLLGAGGNFEAQQQMLEYFLDSRAFGESGDRSRDRKRKHPGEDVKISDVASTCGQNDTESVLFDKANLASLLPAQLTQVTARMVHSQLAVAAMENGNWMEAKKYFEQVLPDDDLLAAPVFPEVLDTARDYIYVLLQCNLPTLALRKCEQFLAECAGLCDVADESTSAILLLLHLYRADALLCLERVDECHTYLKEVVEPVVAKQMERPRDTSASDMSSGVSIEIKECHTQLLNNLAVATACRDGVDSAVTILRAGLQQYHDCLALKFNLVLLLWRKEEQEAACAMWIEARGWNLQMMTSDVGSVCASTETSNPLALVSACENAAIAASEPRNASLSEHVQSDATGEGGVSRQQLVYLDALVLNHWRKIRDSRAVATSLQYVKYLEALGENNDAVHVQSRSTAEHSSPR